MYRDLHIKRLGYGNKSEGYRCSNCKNRKPGLFEEDKRHGQVTCRVCGLVVQDRKVHDGEWKRQFSGEENPSQHGPAPDTRFSSGHNLRTNLSGGVGTEAGSQVSRKELMDLKNAQERVEMNLSNLKFNTNVYATRIGYKDKMKRMVFAQIEDVARSLQLHEVVIHEAQSLFSDFRDAIEQLTGRETVVAACIIIALRKTHESGKTVLTGDGESSMNQERGEKRLNETVVSRAVKPKLSFEQLHPFKCPKCSNMFGTKKDVRFHLKSCSK